MYITTVTISNISNSTFSETQATITLNKTYNMCIVFAVAGQLYLRSDYSSASPREYTSIVPNGSTTLMGNGYTKIFYIAPMLISSSWVGGVGIYATFTGDTITIISGVRRLSQVYTSFADWYQSDRAATYNTIRVDTPFQYIIIAI